MPFQSWQSYILYYPEVFLYHSNRFWQGTGRGHCPYAVVGSVVLQMSAGGVKLSARGERGVTMVSWIPRVRALRFPPGTDRMSLAGRISLSKFRETGVGWSIGRWSISVLLGPADPLSFPAVFCVPNDGNSCLSAAHQLHSLWFPCICQGGLPRLFWLGPPPGSVEL